MSRPDWDSYFLGIATAVSRRSTCPRLSVGCVITYKNKVVTTGYNGAPPGEPHCVDVGCNLIDNHCMRVLHAEVNALHQLKVLSDFLVLYSTHEPCALCRITIKKHRIQNVVWGHPYGTTKS